MNCAPPGAGPTTRMVWLPVSSMVSKESTIADHTVMRPHVDVMVDRVRQVGAGEQAALLPHLDGHRAGADALRICRASESGTMPDGAASSTSAAVLAAAMRSFSRFMRKLAIAGT